MKKFYQKTNIKILLLVGLIIRLASSPWSIHSDVNATYWWGKFAQEFGLRGYYDWLFFGGHGRPDQPMINIYYNLIVRQIYLFLYKIFWFLNIKIPVFPSKLMQWYFDYGNQILLKIPMIIADMLIIYFGYKFISKYLSPAKAKIFALVLTLYPPLIYNSAVWGSGDSIVSLLALLAVYQAWRKKYYSSVLLLFISILYKPSLIIWGPLYLIVLLKNKISFKTFLLLFVFSLILVYVTCFPFSPIEINPIIWFFKTMTIKILPGIMDQVTANALNFWALLYGLEPRLDASLFIGSLSARLFSLLLCVVFYVYELKNLFKEYSLKRLLLSLVNITMITFCFMTRMHERYSFPALIPLFLLALFDRRYLRYFILLSLTHSLNVYYGWWTPFLPKLVSFLKNITVIRLISLINVLITLKLVFLYPKIKNTNSRQSNPPPPKSK